MDNLRCAPEGLSLDERSWVGRDERSGGALHEKTSCNLNDLKRMRRHEHAPKQEQAEDQEAAQQAAHAKTQEGQEPGPGHGRLDRNSYPAS